ncbi:DNA-binding response regulator, LytR/AlgR family [Methylobacterium sp. 174MFSha1.1]|uniref:LytTR family transcriptional regulator DNA-binding domain-containing protein n=1 Tax=Methylobacterium sp. 174MFSha1.1 TaxID=1502749 RepID=UPI0008DF8106|nr:LytTR family transcriptional regulator DNA-binding domain-containing protein [Methylobacterium sp. 174MFSha1.1]SFV17200.1 DNA-binding response regulator, LytR/AlgR family [Methylobacterium sp. 174MFSha1.1]
MELPSPYEFVHPDECADATDLDWTFRAARALLSRSIDAGISAILEATGRASGSDRAWMFEYSSDLTTFRNTHEWCRPFITGYVQDLQDAPVTMFAWLHQQLVAGRAVMVHRVEGLPRQARSLKAEMLRQDDKSILAVPITHDGRLRAAFGFDAVRDYRRWSDAEIKALFRCAELIGLARYADRALPEPASAPATSLIYLRGKRGVRGVDPNAVVCLRSARNYTEVALVDGAWVTDLRTLGLWSSLLPPASFVKVHRTAIVNLRHVRAVDIDPSGAWTVQLRHLPGALPVSRPCRAELKARLGL